MKSIWALVILLALSSLVQGRHISRRLSETSGQEASLGYVLIPSESSPHSNSYSSRDSSSELVAESRGPFSDMLPYVGSFVYRTAVRRVLVKPMIKGMKRLVPPSAVSYIKESVGNRKFFKMVTPLQPMVSTYAYNKFEQGIFWTLKRSYTFVRDSFFDFDERKKREVQHLRK